MSEYERVTDFSLVGISISDRDYQTLPPDTKTLSGCMLIHQDLKMECGFAMCRFTLLKPYSTTNMNQNS